MNVTTFRLENAEHTESASPAINCADAIFRLPILSAYAIQQTKLELDNQIHMDTGYTPAKYVIKNECVIVENAISWPYTEPPTGILIVYYSGIIEYSRLFPHVENKSLRERLGQFSHEVDSAFESQSWMSYVLMVGAVVEGLLFDKFGNKTFGKLIEEADREGIIEPDEVTLFNEVRNLRNRVHANRCNEAFADRKIAMQLSVTYERLLKRQWETMHSVP